MAKLKWEVGSGIDEYIAELQRLGKFTPGMVGKAIYDGAKIVADEVRNNIKKLPVRDRQYKNGNYADKGLTESQKKGLLDGFGISRLQEDGSYKQVKLGFDGYNDTTTKKFPNGQPNAMIARTIESGSSYHQKTPFIAPAVRATKDKAEAAMAERIDEEIQQIFK